MEICDYSTYYQPVVMSDLFGFGKPMDETPMLWQPGILTMAWGSVVRQIAAGLGVILDEPLTETVDRRAGRARHRRASPATSTGRDHGRGPVRGDRQGRRRTPGGARARHPDRRGPGARVAEPPQGGGCYRVVVTGEPHLQLDLSHHGEHGDHNVSGMIVTAQRLVNAVPAVVAARGGLVTALDLPLVTGRGLVSRA